MPPVVAPKPPVTTAKPPVTAGKPPASNAKPAAPAAKPPSTPSTAEDLAQRYGLEAIPESVKRLTQLVARRNASTDDFAKLITADKEMTARFLRIANPKAESEADYTCTTVEEGLARVGMNWVLLIAMVDPLRRAVMRSFDTMLDIKLQQLTVNQMVPFVDEHIRGEVGFAGKSTGVVHLRLQPGPATLIAARLLGVSAAELTDPSQVDDVIGELSNIVAGNFKSNLCDAQLECKLSPPQIIRTPDFRIHRPSGTVAERFSFRAAELDLYVDLSVNPWTE